MKRSLLIATAVLSVAVVTTIGLALSIWHSGRPVREGNVELAGLEGPVTVRWDRWGVPHATAGHERDLAVALGFLHANDRLFQMESARRFCTGRLSELVGQATLKIDIKNRHLRLVQSAREEWARLPDATRDWLEAYAHGVNSWIRVRQGDLPTEFRVSGIEPEAWTPVDSICMHRNLAASLSLRGLKEDENALRWVRTIGPERTRRLLGYDAMHVPPALLDEQIPAEPSAPPGPPEVKEPPGSNAWAVAGGHASTKGALLANDPHLQLFLPSWWYQVSLSAPGYKVAGLTFPGLPQVIVGQSEALAWGVTATMLDAADLSLEQLDETGTRVRRGDGWEKIHQEEHVIEIRGKEPEAVTVGFTERGAFFPADESNGSPAFSLSWTGYQVGDPLGAFGRLSKVDKVEDVPAAMESYLSPPLNLFVADRHGDILQTVIGTLPERKGSDGKLPVPGWDPAYGWEKTRSPLDNPVATSPEHAWLSNANDVFRPPNYELSLPHYRTRPAYRADRIRELLGKEQLWTPSSLAEVQRDVVSAYAKDVVSHLQRMSGWSRLAQEAMGVLSTWNGQMAVRGPAALLTLFEDDLIPRVLRDDFEHFGVADLPKREVFTINILSESFDPEWFDDRRTVATETKQEIVDRALSHAWSEGKRRWGDDVSQWDYGSLHELQISHPFGKIPILGQIFRRGSWPMPSSSSTVACLRRTPYGSSLRFVANTEDPNQSMVIIPGGQSGHPADTHFDDQISDYRQGKYRLIHWSDESVLAATVSTLILNP